MTRLVVVGAAGDVFVFLLLLLQHPDLEGVDVTPPLPAAAAMVAPASSLSFVL
jgi:hypothetical protein